MDSCSRCGAEFVRTAQQVRKWDHICLGCKRKREAARRAKRKAEGRPVISTKMPRSYFAEYEKHYQATEKFKIRSKAGYLARNAVKKGAIAKKACEVCGNSKSEMHHLDYSRPLHVTWLCKSHHEDAHHKARGGV